jgi:tetratricopeptide (TPR) repeat protein
MHKLQANNEDDIKEVKINEEKKIKPLQKKDAKEQFKLGVSLLKTGQNQEEALSALREANRLAPAKGPFNYYLGNTLFKLKDYQEAAAAYEKAIRAEPNNEEYNLMLAYCYYNLEKRPDDRNALIKSLSINPNNAKAHYFLGQCYSQTDNLRLVIEQYNILQKLEPSYAKELYSLLTDDQKFILVIKNNIGSITAFFLGFITLFPPFIFVKKHVVQLREWSFIFFSPVYAKDHLAMKIDVSTLMIEYVGVIFFALALKLLIKNKYE